MACRHLQVLSASLGVVRPAATCACRLCALLLFFCFALRHKLYLSASAAAHCAGLITRLPVRFVATVWLVQGTQRHMVLGEGGCGGRL